MVRRLGAGTWLLLAAAPACGLVFGDYEVDPDFAAASTGSAAATGTGGNSASTEGAGAGTGSSQGGGGSGGAGGAAPVDCDAPASEKPTVAVEGELTADDIWTCDRNYRLVGNVYVTDGVDLTIQAGTTVFGDLVTVGALVVQQGGRILADGTADRPIVFTSEGGNFAGPGDWGGVVVLGRAPINLKGPGGDPIPGEIEGIVSGGRYGGDDPEDSSGSLQYVRIEFGGSILASNNELNGLTLGGVGRGTVVDHVLVRQTTDDCFELFGGTVDVKHLICQAPGDDGFDWDEGYQGRMQFLVLQTDPAFVPGGDMNGFEADGDVQALGIEPRSAPTIANVTFCGHDYDDGEQYALLARKATEGSIINGVFTGFEAGVDVRDDPTNTVDVRSSIFFANAQANVAYVEDLAGRGVLEDDDQGYDELATLLDPARDNAETDPGIVDCASLTAPDFRPAAPLTDGAATPDDDGFFDAGATYIGAFSGPDDDWATGNWVRLGPAL